MGKCILYSFSLKCLRLIGLGTTQAITLYSICAFPASQILLVNSSTLYTGQDLVLDEYCGRFENLIYRKEIFETPSVYFNKTVLLTTCWTYRGSCTADKVRYLFLNDWVFTVFTLSSFQNNAPIFLENVVFVQSVLFSFSKSKKLFSDFQFQIIFTDCNCL